MDVSSGDITSMVFKRSVRQNIGEVSLDSQMLGVLMELDGQKNLGIIAQKLNLSLPAIRDVVSRLSKLGLIESQAVSVPTIDKEFFDFLTAQLSLAIGPIAEVIIEDAVADLGYDFSEVPCHQAAELVDLLSREIQREDKKNAFKMNMVNKIREKGF